MMPGDYETAAALGTVDRSPTDDEALRQAARRRAAPVVSWLLEERLGIGRTALLFKCFCVRLGEVGISIDRATIHMPQLHPQLSARSLQWTREAGEAVETGHRHADRQSDFYLRSPVRHIFEGGPALRRQVSDLEARTEFPVLEDLYNQGLRDYVILPLPFSAGQANAISFATKSENGFDALDLATLEAVLPAFGAVMELNHMRRTADTLLDTARCAGATAR
jgi:adenylate cyclase